MTPSEFQDWMKDELRDINLKIGKLDVAIRGNGKDGLVLRMDRLERAGYIRRKIEWALGAGFLLFLGEQAWTHFMS